MNDILQAMITRRSCKSFLPDPVPQEMIDGMIEAGLYAASWMGRQMPVILAVTDPQERDLLSRLNARYDALKRPDPFYGAPAVLCVLVPKDAPAGVEDGSLVLGNLMLAAHSLGIGSCWIHRARQVFEDPEGIALLRRAGLDETYRGVGHCVIGYPKKQNDRIPPRREGRVFRL